MTTNIQLRYAETDGIKTLQYRVGREVISSTGVIGLKTVSWDEWRDVPTVVIDKLLTDKEQP